MYIHEFNSSYNSHVLHLLSFSSRQPINQVDGSPRQLLVVKEERGAAHGDDSWRGLWRSMRLGQSTSSSTGRNQVIVVAGLESSSSQGGRRGSPGSARPAIWPADESMGDQRCWAEERSGKEREGASVPAGDVQPGEAGEEGHYEGDPASGGGGRRARRGLNYLTHCKLAINDLPLSKPSSTSPSSTRRPPTSCWSPSRLTLNCPMLIRKGRGEWDGSLD